MKGFSSRSLLAMRMEASRRPTALALKVTLKVIAASGVSIRRLIRLIVYSLECAPAFVIARPFKFKFPMFLIVKVLLIRPLPTRAVPKLIFEVLETKLLPAGCWTSISGAEMAMRAMLLVTVHNEL